MDRILIILKTNGPRASSAPALGLNTLFIGICSRSQVSVYRTIGPLVFFLLGNGLTQAETKEKGLQGLRPGPT